MDERRIKRNIWTTLTLGAGFSLIAIASMTGEETDTQPHIGASPDNGSESFSLTAEDLIREGWNPNCQTINNPIDSYHNDDLPDIPNAFRAVIAAGGDPNKGPFLHIPGPLGTAVRNSQGLDSKPYEVKTLMDFNPWDEKKQPKSYTKVHNGDRICIKKEPHSLKINPEKLHEVIFDGQNKEFNQRSKNIQATIRAKQGF